MTAPPDAVLEAALTVLHRGLIYARNASLPSRADIPQVNSLMEALHELPDMLAHWPQHSVEELRVHLASFDHSKWTDGPDLVGIFDSALRDRADGRQRI